jgi:hypothetical protein
LPGYEGRFSCVALIVDTSQFSLDDLYVYVMRELPSYAAPLFVRLVDSVEMTGTSKIRKTPLVDAGVDPAVVGTERTYFRDDKQKKYIPLTSQLWEAIVKQSINV